jgi:hypothetical protein
MNNALLSAQHFLFADDPPRTSFLAFYNATTDERVVNHHSSQSKYQ